MTYNLISPISTFMHRNWNRSERDRQRKKNKNHICSIFNRIMIMFQRYFHRISCPLISILFVTQTNSSYRNLIKLLPLCILRISTISISICILSFIFIDSRSSDKIRLFACLFSILFRTICSVYYHHLWINIHTDMYMHEKHSNYLKNP